MSRSWSAALPRFANPILPGFNPDPSIVAVDGWYYLATSSFEYLPGLPIYRSRDLVEWDVIGHVVDRPGQLQMENVPTGGGAFAPTLRYRDGLFYLVVTDAMGRGTLIFTAADPTGPWSDGLVVESVEGIDPDLAWDEDGTCFMTYSGSVGNTESGQQKHGIKQLKIDLQSGEALSEATVLWSGTGLMFPEAPHLYQVGSWWYLLLAEGGTERGHAISVARSEKPDGPFVGNPSNPIMSASGTARQIQNTGHADFLQCFDGLWKAVLLGMHTQGETRAFSPLGRQTFMTDVDWVDGWPEMHVVTPGEPAEGVLFSDTFEASSLGRDWVGVRQRPGDVSSLEDDNLVLEATGHSMDSSHPTFVGIRQQQQYSTIETVLTDRAITDRVTTDGVTADGVTTDGVISGSAHADDGEGAGDPATVAGSGGVGGLTLRYDEHHHFDVEVDGDQVTARACLATISTSASVVVPNGPITLYMSMSRPEPRSSLRYTCDLVALGWVDAAGERHEIAQYDGRFLAAETMCSFTGRVAGLYCSSGTVRFESYCETA